MSVLPSRCRKYLTEREVALEEVDGPQKAVILRAYPVTSGRFNVDKADFLIVLPSGYPDVRPDMFYALPWLKLMKGDRYPNCADQPFDFSGQRWQRWSRHQEQWRPGVDGIWTMLRRLDAALEAAA
ncbi:MAG: E2/UBC family protein [bacterium]|nr:E2/UBC family protein [bacterium]